jgi:hypothetical protein
MKYSVLLLLVTLAGCMAQPTVTSWLDPVSVATITSQTEPLVLVRASAFRRINQREYAQLTAIEINRMGARRLYLALIVRSTGDLTPKQRASFESSFDQVEMRVDGRTVALTPHTGSVAELGLGQAALPLPIAGATPIYFPIERAELRAIAASTQVELVAHGLTGASQLYEEWSDGRRSLGDFLSQLPGDPADALPLSVNGQPPVDPSS